MQHKNQSGEIFACPHQCCWTRTTECAHCKSAARGHKFGPDSTTGLCRRSKTRSGEQYIDTLSPSSPAHSNSMSRHTWQSLVVAPWCPMMGSYKLPMFAKAQAFLSKHVPSDVHDSLRWEPRTIHGLMSRQDCRRTPWPFSRRMWQFHKLPSPQRDQFGKCGALTLFINGRHSKKLNIQWRRTPPGDLRRNMLGRPPLHAHTSSLRTRSSGRKQVTEATQQSG
jgi:hypothetical protein